MQLVAEEVREMADQSPRANSRVVFASFLCLLKGEPVGNVATFCATIMIWELGSRSARIGTKSRTRIRCTR